MTGPPSALRWYVKKAMRHGLVLLSWGSGYLALQRWLGRKPRIRALTYHRFRSCGRDPFSVDAKRFEEHMRWLADQELAISLSDLQGFLAGRQDVRDGAVLVTIDDGYEEIWSVALPILRKYGIPAVAFVSTAEIHDTEAGAQTVASPDAGPRLSSWELMALPGASVEVGSHSWQHRSLGRMDPEEAGRQVRRSRRDLEALLGRPITAFAYPFGTQKDFNATTARLLAMLSELYEQLPEVGDLEKPKIVFFFDEAHLLFEDAPDALLEKIEQVVRLIRSKGVGVYFVTQNPLDVPDVVLGQLGNRVQHALRAFTPRDQKAVRTAAETLRPNPRIDAVTAIAELSVGEALVSFLDANGSPTIVERAWILPPASRIGAIAPAERQSILAASPLAGHYEHAIDRESAYETLKARTAERSEEPPAPKPRGGRREPMPPMSQPEAPRVPKALKDLLLGSTGPRGGRHEGLLGSAARSAARSVGSGLGRQILRGVLGSILGGRR